MNMKQLKKNDNIIIRINAEVKTQFKKLATANGQTVTAAIEALILKDLKSQGLKIISLEI